MTMTTPLDQEEQETIALVALRDSFVWQHDDRWPSRAKTLTEYCTMIPGITCNQSLSSVSSSRQNAVVVTAIDFTSRHLQGTIPSEIGYLTNLVRLKLGNNQLHGTLPLTLSHLTLLEHLEVYRNNLTGTLPVLSPLSKLKRLLTQSNHFHGTLSPTLCDLTSLLGLDLFKNAFEGTIPACFDNMERLQSLQIQGNRLTGTVPWAICDRMGVECSAVACPMATYGPIKGRQSTSMECLPCPTAMYLGSTVCPESNSPSVSPLPTMPVRAPTIEPSTRLPQPTTYTPPSPWSDDTYYYNGDEWDYDDALSSEVTLVPTPDFVSKGDTTPRSTQGSLVSTTTPVMPFGKNTTFSTGQSTDWTLLTAAFVLSALALLSVVVTRRHYKIRDDRWWIQPHQEDDNKDVPPISSLILVPTLSRDPHSISSNSNDNNDDTSSGGGLDQGDEYSMLERQPEHVHDITSTLSFPKSFHNNNHHHHHNNNKKDDDYCNIHNNHSNNDHDDDESLESDSGWNDTESSIGGDDDDDHNDHNNNNDDASKNDKKKDLYPSIYRWGTFFINPVSVPA